MGGPFWLGYPGITGCLVSPGAPARMTFRSWQPRLLFSMSLYYNSYIILIVITMITIENSNK